MKRGSDPIVPVEGAATAGVWSIAGLAGSGSPRNPSKAPSGGARVLPHWDRELVSRACAGDSVAFDALYEVYRDRVYGYIANRVRDRAEAEDLTQETFIQAYRSLASFEGRSSLLSWLIGIARFVCLRHCRFCSRWMIGPEPRSIGRDFRFDDPVEERVDAIRKLERCEAFLAEACGESNRAIFHLRYREARSIRAIASAVGKSEDAVKACLRRSRLALAKRLLEPRNGPSPRALLPS